MGLTSMTQKSLAELRKIVNQAYLADEKQPYQRIIVLRMGTVCAFQKALSPAFQ